MGQSIRKVLLEQTKNCSSTTLPPSRLEESREGLAKTATNVPRVDHKARLQILWYTQAPGADAVHRVNLLSVLWIKK